MSALKVNRRTRITARMTATVYLVLTVAVISVGPATNSHANAESIELPHVEYVPLLFYWSGFKVLEISILIFLFLQDFQLGHPFRCSNVGNWQTSDEDTTNTRGKRMMKDHFKWFNQGACSKHSIRQSYKTGSQTEESRRWLFLLSYYSAFFFFWSWHIFTINCWVLPTLKHNTRHLLPSTMMVAHVSGIN